MIITATLTLPMKPNELVTSSAFIPTVQVFDNNTISFALVCKFILVGGLSIFIFSFTFLGYLQ